MARQSTQFRAKQITDEITIAPVAQMRFPPASLQVKKKQMAGRMLSKNFMYLGSPCQINLFYHYYLVMVHLLCERIQAQWHGELGKRPRKTKTAGIPAVKFATFERLCQKGAFNPEIITIIKYKAPRSKHNKKTSLEQRMIFKMSWLKFIIAS